MGRPSSGRSRTVRKIVGYTPAESEKLQRKFVESTCQTMSEYIRRLSLELPIRINYRDSSLDTLIDELITFRVVMEDIRSALTISPDQVIQILNKLEEIYTIINKIADHVCQNQRHK